MIRTEGDALVYLIDCTLATVTSMAMKKSRSVGEFKRQIAIAQKGINWAMEFRTPLDSRPAEVVKKFKGNVTAWADAFIARRVAP